jgi:signal peptidase I
MTGLVLQEMIEKIKLLRKTIEISYIDNTTGTHGDIIVYKHSDQKKRNKFYNKKSNEEIKLAPSTILKPCRVSNVLISCSFLSHRYLKFKAVL